MSVIKNIGLFLSFSVVISCSSLKSDEQGFIEISKKNYQDQLEGFWMGQLIANWTGLITENDKIGNIGEIKTGDFYTREDWGKTDQRSIWEDDTIDKSNIIGNKIKQPPAGEGMPWKKFIFHSSLLSNFVKLNLANLKTQQTENNNTRSQPIFPS